MASNYEKITYIEGHLHIECRECGELKPEERYHKNPNNVYGRVYKCIQCINKTPRSTTLETADEKYASTAKQILINMGYDITKDIHTQFLQRMKDKGKKI
jgi:hypothetical protein